MTECFLQQIALSIKHKIKRLRIPFYILKLAKGIIYFARLPTLAAFRHDKPLVYSWQAQTMLAAMLALALWPPPSTVLCAEGYASWFQKLCIELLLTMNSLSKARMPLPSLALGSMIEDFLVSDTPTEFQFAPMHTCRHLCQLEFNP